MEYPNILSIEVVVDDINNGYYDGYRIVTTNGSFSVGISNSQSCCEEWGYVCSHDDFGDFIGAQLFGIQVVDDQLQVTDMERPEYEGSAMFVNLVTSRGSVQFVMYNDHNGNYSHRAIVIAGDEVIHEEYL